MLGQYRYLIFDADHTVIDFNADERRAFRLAFDAIAMPYTEEMIEECWRYSAQNWDELGLNKVHLPEIQEAYHRMYHEHIRLLYRFVDEKYRLGDKREEAQAVFEKALTLPSYYVDRADEVLKDLSTRYRVCIATNGITELQVGRLSALKPYLYRVYISEEMGCIKPMPVFFEKILEDLHATKEECLMIGDSLSSDVKGANAVGIDCVWLNQRGTPLPEGVSAVQISSLAELKNLL